MRAQPPESELALAGATPHAPADARLPPAFKRAFVLDAPRGGLAQAAGRDPAGGGRARAVTRYDASPRHIVGEVSRGVREERLR